MEETEKAMFRLEVLRVVASVMEGSSPEQILETADKHAHWVLTGGIQ